MFKIISLILHFSLLLVISHPVFSALPTVEAPQSSGGPSLLGQGKGYLQDGIVLGGLVLAAIAFYKVAEAALVTYSKVQAERAGWGQFGAIVVVGILLIVAIIWLLGKSANIIL